MIARWLVAATCLCLLTSCGNLDVSSGCKLLTPHEVRALTYKGSCAGDIADGGGVAFVSMPTDRGLGIVRIEGNFRAGVPFGWAKVAAQDGTQRFEGDYTDWQAVNGTLWIRQQDGQTVEHEVRDGQTLQGKSSNYIQQSQPGYAPSPTYGPPVTYSPPATYAPAQSFYAPAKSPYAPQAPAYAPTAPVQQQGQRRHIPEQRGPTPNHPAAVSPTYGFSGYPPAATYSQQPSSQQERRDFEQKRAEQERLLADQIRADEARQQVIRAEQLRQDAVLAQQRKEQETQTRAQYNAQQEQLKREADQLRLLQEAESAKQRQEQERKFAEAAAVKREQERLANEKRQEIQALRDKESRELQAKWDAGLKEQTEKLAQGAKDYQATLDRATKEAQGKHIPTPSSYSSTAVYTIPTAPGSPANTGSKSGSNDAALSTAQTPANSQSSSQYIYPPAPVYSPATAATVNLPPQQGYAPVPTYTTPAYSTPAYQQPSYAQSEAVPSPQNTPSRIDRPIGSALNKGSSGSAPSTVRSNAPAVPSFATPTSPATAQVMYGPAKPTAVAPVQPAALPIAALGSAVGRSDTANSTPQTALSSPTQPQPDRCASANLQGRSKGDLVAIGAYCVARHDAQFFQSLAGCSATAVGEVVQGLQPSNWPQIANQLLASISRVINDPGLLARLPSAIVTDIRSEYSSLSSAVASNDPSAAGTHACRFGLKVTSTVYAAEGGVSAFKLIKKLARNPVSLAEDVNRLGIPVAAVAIRRTFSNQLPERLSEELASAEHAKFAPARPGDQNFERFVNESFLYVVLPSGDLLVAPDQIGNLVVKHTMLSKGGPVLAAGHASGFMNGNQRVVWAIDANSGHYLNGATAEQSRGVIEIAEVAFEQAGFTKK